MIYLLLYRKGIYTFTACHNAVDRSYNVWQVLAGHIMFGYVTTSVSHLSKQLYYGISSNYANKGLINMNDIRRSLKTRRLRALLYHPTVVLLIIIHNNQNTKDKFKV